MPPKRFEVGDVIVFHRGAHAKWHVERFLKKVAVLRLNNPLPLGFAIRAVNKLRSLIARWSPMITPQRVAIKSRPSVFPPTCTRCCVTATPLCSVPEDQHAR